MVEEHKKIPLIGNELRKKGAVAAWKVMSSPYEEGKKTTLAEIREIIYIKEYKKEGEKVYRIMEYNPSGRDSKIKPKGTHNYYNPENLKKFIDIVEDKIIDKYSTSYQRLKL